MNKGRQFFVISYRGRYRGRLFNVTDCLDPGGTSYAFLVLESMDSSHVLMVNVIMQVSKFVIGFSDRKGERWVLVLIKDDQN